MTWYQIVALFFALLMSATTGTSLLRWTVKRDVSVHIVSIFVFVISIVALAVSFTGVS